MTSTVEELSARAKALSAAERARLAAELLDSLDNGVDDDAEAAWNAEIARRVAEAQAGTVQLVPADEVHAEARRLIGR